jgi:hypothetical protein
MTRAARRGVRRSGGFSPEQIAIGLAIAIYGSALILGGALRAGGPSPGPSVQAAASEALPSPRESANPIRAQIAAILEIDARLLEARTELRGLLARKDMRGSDVAFVMRRISQSLALGPDRASQLSADPTTKSVGAQLEILYGNASTTTGQALDLAIGSDDAYRQAAQDIVDLFADLPSIDAHLQEILTGASPTPEAGASSSPSSPTSSGRPTRSPSPTASSTVAPSVVPVTDPGERLVDPGFENGLASWALVLASGADRATAASDSPLVGTGHSLRVDVTASDGGPAAIGVAQTGVHLQAFAKYLATITVRSSVARQIEIRVVGPNEEPYAVKVGDVSPTTSIVAIEFTAVADEPAATFRIDIDGPAPGSVWLDAASLALQATP